MEGEGVTGGNLGLDYGNGTIRGSAGLNFNRDGITGGSLDLRMDDKSAPDYGNPTLNLDWTPDGKLSAKAGMRVKGPGGRDIDLSYDSKNGFGAAMPVDDYGLRGGLRFNQC